MDRKAYHIRRLLAAAMLAARHAPPPDGQRARAAVEIPVRESRSGLAAARGRAGCRRARAVRGFRIAGRPGRALGRRCVRLPPIARLLELQLAARDSAATGRSEAAIRALEEARRMLADDARALALLERLPR